MIVVSKPVTPYYCSTRWGRALLPLGSKGVRTDLLPTLKQLLNRLTLWVESIAGATQVVLMIADWNPLLRLGNRRQARKRPSLG